MKYIKKFFIIILTIIWFAIPVMAEENIGLLDEIGVLIKKGKYRKAVNLIDKAKQNGTIPEKDKNKIETLYYFLRYDISSKSFKTEYDKYNGSYSFFKRFPEFLSGLYGSVYIQPKIVLKNKEILGVSVLIDNHYSGNVYKPLKLMELYSDGHTTKYELKEINHTYKKYNGVKTYYSYYNIILSEKEFIDFIIEMIGNEVSIRFSGGNVFEVRVGKFAKKFFEDYLYAIPYIKSNDI